MTHQFYYRRPSTLPVFLAALWLLLFSTSAAAQFWKNQGPQLLPEEQAFAVTASVSDAGELLVDWSIAEDYYLYRDQFLIETDSAGVQIDELKFAEGVIENDPEFGEVEVYFFNAPIRAAIRGSGEVQLTLRAQGCNKPVGVCYPPMARRVSVTIPDGFAAMDLAVDGRSQGAPSVESAEKPAEQNQEKTLDQENPSDQENKKGYLAYMVSAFLAGILLSFTPCVLPMIPILAGVIAGQENVSRWRSGWLAFCYVAGTIVTYMFAGALAGATGTQLQAWFQNPWVIGAICSLLLLLALSLFGAFRLELPSAIQTRLSSANATGRSAAWSSFSLGLISALVVGACVSPVLILALGAAITQGDPVLGAVIMGSMALGMGLLLILFGFGAGWLLPRTGAWMQHIQVMFGLMVIGVAIYLLAAFPAVPILLLWSALLLCSGFYMWQVSSEVEQALPKSVLRMLATGLLLWGGLALFGGAVTKPSQGGDILRPLSGFSLSTGTRTDSANLVFEKTTRLAEVQEQLSLAAQLRQPVMLDFYADWCLDCKRMHRTTFKQASVQQALRDWRLIEVDVTNTSADSEAVKQYFGVFGPPATLFFANDGSELTKLRQYGYINERNFLDLVSRAKAGSQL